MKSYYTNPETYLSQRYLDILTRVEGRDPKTGDRVKGLPVEFTKAQFIKWGLNHPKFLGLFENWKERGHIRALAPSIDRLDPSKGYTKRNLDWLTQSENSRLGGINSYRVQNGLSKLTRKQYERQLA